MTKRGLVAHRKLSHAGGCCFLDSHLRNLRRGWAAMEQVDHLPDRRFLTFEMRLDTAVRSVANPARYTQLARLFGGPCAEEDALDKASHAEVAGHFPHQTV